MGEPFGAFRVSCKHAIEVKARLHPPSRGCDVGEAPALFPGLRSELRSGEAGEGGAFASRPIVTFLAPMDTA